MITDLFSDDNKNSLGEIVSIGGNDFLVNLMNNSVFRIVSRSEPQFGYIIIAIAPEKDVFIVHNWLYGVVNTEGKAIIPCKYRSIEFRKENLFHVELDCPSDCWPRYETFSFDIDNTGALIIHSLNGDQTRPDLDGIAKWDSMEFAKCYVKGRFGLIDSSGSFIIRPLYSRLDYSGGAVKASNENETSFFVYSPFAGMQKLSDKTVDVISLEPYTYYKVQDQEGYWGTGFPSSPFKICIPFIYSELRDIRINGELYFIAKKNGLYGIIKDGEGISDLTDYKYDHIQDLWINGDHLFLLDINDKRGLYSVNEERLLIDATVFEKDELDINTYGEGMIGIRYKDFRNGHCGFFNTVKGEMTIQFEDGWRIREPFSNGKTTISNSIHWKIINKDGEALEKWIEEPSRIEYHDTGGWEDAFDGDPSMYWNID